MRKMNELKIFESKERKERWETRKLDTLKLFLTMGEL